MREEKPLRSKGPDKYQEWRGPKDRAREFRHNER